MSDRDQRLADILRKISADPENPYYYRLAANLLERNGKEAQEKVFIEFIGPLGDFTVGPFLWAELNGSFLFVGVEEGTLELATLYSPAEWMPNNIWLDGPDPHLDSLEKYNITDEFLAGHYSRFII